MELQYHSLGEKSRRIRRRQGSLSREEEQEIADRGPDYVLGEMHPLLVEMSQVPAGSGYQTHPGYVRLNTLIWIWVQMNAEMVQSNIFILMGCHRIHSINQLARETRLNASFISRLVGMEGPVGFCGWNTENVFRLAHALGKVRPELMLQVDLKKAVMNEVVNWQI